MRIAIAALLPAILISGCASIPSQLLVKCTPERDDSGHIARSRKAVAEFKRLHPCPNTGFSTGACPDYVIDHIQPLCACGHDTPANMQWQTVADAKLKDRDERKMCRRE
jgi:hypothetical protein